MKSISTTVITVIITFIITFLLNVMVNFYSHEIGTIAISEPINIDQKLFKTITIENYSKEYLDDLAVEIPKNISLENVTSSSPIVVKEVSSTKSSSVKLISISKLPPRAVTRIFITIENSASKISIINNEKLGIIKRQENDLPSPIIKAFEAAFIMSLIYLIFTAWSAYDTRRQIKKSDENRKVQHEKYKSEMDIIKNDALQIKDELTKKLTVAKTETDRLKVLVLRQKTLLHARIFDYAKELEFWRNTYKKILIKSNKTLQDGENFINTVTKSLETYGTKETQLKFEEMNIAAAWIHEAESKTKKKNDD